MTQLPSADLNHFLIPGSLDRPGDDPIFSLHGEAVRRIQKGDDVLNATIGALMEDSGQMAVMPAVDAAYRQVPQVRGSAYAPIAGDPGFLKSVTEDLYGGTALPECSVAVATPGGTGAIYASIVNFLERGQALLTTSYYWSPYAIMAEHHGRRVETFEMFDGDGGFHLAAFEEGLRRMVADQGRALVVLNFPCHNPTGYSMHQDEWPEVARIVNAVGEGAPVAVLIDHAYAKFGAPGSERWVEHAESMTEKAVVLVAWSASKAFALYGARVGALVASCRDEGERKRIGQALSYSCRGTWSNCNHLGMLAVGHILQDPEMRRSSEEERARMRGLLDERVAAFNELAVGAGLAYPRYEGGFFVSVFTPDPKLTALHMKEESGVFVVPLQGAVRVALCALPVSRVQRVVDALAAGVRAAEQAR